MVCVENNEVESNRKGKLLDETTYNSFHERFQKVLNTLFKDFFNNRYAFPFPPMLENGNSVDLFRLFFLVRENGGYENVTNNGLWSFISKECGLELGHATAVKLVYVKYLDVVEKVFASNLKDKKSDEDWSILRNLGLETLMGLETEFKGSLLDIPSSKKKSKIASNLVVLDDDMGKSEATESNNGKKNSNDDNNDNKEKSEATESNNVKRNSNDNNNDGKMKSEPTEVNRDKYDSDSDDDVMILPPSAWEEVSNRKRKREALFGILDWVTETAKDPCHSMVNSLPDSSKWKSYGNEEPWKQILLYRKTMSRYVPADSSSAQKRNPRPCLYDDHAEPSYNLRDRGTCTRNLLSEQTTPQIPSKTENSSDEQLDHYMENMKSFFDDPSNIDSDDDEVPVGRKYQVDVPEWTGAVTPSDPQWLGTLVWPLAREMRKNLIEKGATGKGRLGSCGCHSPGSVDCVRLHIDEERKRLKLELGPAYRHWKLGKIGERVKTSWTPEEENKFIDLKEAKSQFFWDEIKTVLPNKTRKQLVSYYFNVYLVKRRAYQNRHSPTAIDSEDEEFGKELAPPPKHKGIKSSPKSLFRSPTKSHRKT
ncbi:hypothetical protein ACFE04_017545 [Oxalis oulophora]